MAGDDKAALFINPVPELEPSLLGNIVKEIPGALPPRFGDL